MLPNDLFSRVVHKCSVLLGSCTQGGVYKKRGFFSRLSSLFESCTHCTQGLLLLTKLIYKYVQINVYKDRKETAQND